MPMSLQHALLHCKPDKLRQKANVLLWTLCQVEIDPEGALCCDGIVYSRRSGTDQRCCDRVAYDSNQFVCCGPSGRTTVVRRSAVLPDCCYDRSECSAAGNHPQYI